MRLGAKSLLWLEIVFIHLDNQSRLNELEAYQRDNFPMNGYNGAQNRQQYQNGASSSTNNTQNQRLMNNMFEMENEAQGF